MKVKFVIIVLITISISLLSILKLPDSRKSLKSIKSKTKGLKSSIKYSSYNPHTDIKLFIIQEYPDIAKKANEIITRQGVNFNNFNEYKYLTYYLYLLDKHEQVIELAGKTPYSLNYLSFLYLLPASLYEEIGFSELAQKDYNRFLLGTNSILSESKPNTFQENFFQHKVSVARIKKQFLQRSIPSVRKEYYSASYFSVVLNNFFDGISEKRFLAEYRKNKIIEPVMSGYNNALEFDNHQLHKISNQYEVHEIPFITYELYAASCNWKCSYYNPDYSNADCSILNYYDEYKLKASLLDNSTDEFLFHLYIFRNGRNMFKAGEYKTALIEFQKIKDMPYNQDLEFLRDDAYIFSALSLLNLKDYNSAWIEFVNVCKDFENSTSDAKIAGNEFLNEFNYLVEASKYYE